MRSFVAVSLLVLAGCSGSSVADSPPVRKAESAAALQAQSRSFRVASGELVVIEVPLQSGRRVVWQRCFVWRGASETLTCPSDSSDFTPTVPDDPQPVGERY